MRLIKIDDEVWEELKKRAEPFVDSENDVLRRVFGLDNHPRRSLVHREEIGQITKNGYGLREVDYKQPILEVVVSMGGHAKFTAVLDAVGKRVKDRFTVKDLEPHPSGGPRWRNRAAFERLRMVHEGLLASNSPRGIWEITDLGRRWLSHH